MTKYRTRKTIKPSNRGLKKRNFNRVNTTGAKKFPCVTPRSLSTPIGLRHRFSSPRLHFPGICLHRALGPHASEACPIPPPARTGELLNSIIPLKAVPQVALPLGDCPPYPT